MVDSIHRYFFFLAFTLLCLFSSCKSSGTKQTVELGTLEAEKLPHILKETKYHSTVSPTWIDTNNDNQLERFVYFYKAVANTLILNLEKLNGGSIQQYNIPGAQAFTSHPYLFADINNDGKQEVVFSYSIGDTTYLEVLKDDLQTRLYRFPVAHAVKGFGTLGKRPYKVIAIPQKVFDSDQDGSLDILCSFVTSFQAVPRGLFVYNLATGHLIHSYRMPQNPGPLLQYNYTTIWYEDFNGDGKPEAVPAYYYAVDNGIHVNGRDDSHSYLFVLDEKLQETYVEELSGRFSFVQTFPIATPEGKRLLMISSSGAADPQKSARLRLYNLSTMQVERRNETIKEPLALNSGMGVILDDLTNDGQPNILVGTMTGDLILLDWRLGILQTHNFSEPLEPALAVDLDGDGIKEIICNSIMSKDLIILDHNFEVQSVLPGVNSSYGFQAVPEKPSQPPLLAVKMLTGQQILYRYQRNFRSIIPTVIWPVTGIFLLGLFLLSARGVYRTRREKRNRLIAMEFSEAGMLLLNHKGKINALNQRARDLLNLNGSAINSSYLREILKTADIETQKLLNSIMEIFHQRSQTSEMHDLRKGKNILRLSLRTRPIYAEFGKFDGMMISLWDETAILEHDRALSWAAMAQRMAHEIKSPLSTIGLTAQRLQMEYRKDNLINQAEYDQYIKSILEETRHFQQVAKGFMQFVNLEKPNAKPVDLTAFFNAYQEEIATGLPAGIKFSVDFIDDDLTILADKNLLRSALQNAIENAVDAMKRQGLLSIRIEKAQHLQNHSDDGKQQDQILIEITDTGAGIPGDKLAEIFKPYYTTKSTGTGMGLAIIKKIVTDHGGDVHISSRVGRGTSVFLYWPQA